MKKRNGFTLIELLAVIIILAIVALIATPIVLDVVEDSRKSAATSEANMIISGINNYCATQAMRVQMGIEGATACPATLTDTEINAAVDKSEKTTVTNAKIVNGKLDSATIVSNGYTVTVTGGNAGTPSK